MTEFCFYVYEPIPPAEFVVDDYILYYEDSNDRYINFMTKKLIFIIK